MITYGPFILFEGIGKNFPFNSILDFAILSDFKTRTVFTTEDGGGSSVGFQPAKSFVLPCPTPIF